MAVIMSTVLGEQTVQASECTKIGTANLVNKCTNVTRYWIKVEKIFLIWQKGSTTVFWGHLIFGLLCKKICHREL